MTFVRGALSLLLFVPTLTAETRLEVSACLQLKTSLDYVVLRQGENVTQQIFNGIGIRLRWSCNPPPARAQRETRTIMMQLVGHAPDRFRKGSLAYALPYAHQGVQVTVFYDRFEPFLVNGPISASKIFGHILAHEIGHVLAGVSAHAEVGLMRANWTGDDVSIMNSQLLTFTDQDARFIRDNLRRDCGR
ncbi:MAG: hypothetical protein ACR2I2_05485 [Bryobacteraceae bacterium]